MNEHFLPKIYLADSRIEMDSGSLLVFRMEIYHERKSITNPGIYKDHRPAHRTGRLFHWKRALPEFKAVFRYYGDRSSSETDLRCLKPHLSAGKHLLFRRPGRPRLSEAPGDRRFLKHTGASPDCEASGDYLTGEIFWSVGKFRP